MTEKYYNITCVAQANNQNCEEYGSAKYPVCLYLDFENDAVELDERVKDFFMQVGEDNAKLDDVSGFRRRKTKYECYFNNMDTYRKFAHEVLGEFNLKNEIEGFSSNEKEIITPRTVILDGERMFNYVNRHLC